MLLSTAERSVEGLTYPRLCALLGDRPSKLSQAMHNAAFQDADLPFSYVAINTTDTKKAFDAMRDFGFRGYSLTIPHKEAAMRLVDVKHEDVEGIGATNTVLNENGTLVAYNTDWYGIVEAIHEAEWSVRGKKALIYGAGGASRAAIYALKEEGASQIAICNRTPGRAMVLAEEFSVDSIEAEELDESAMAEFGLFINSSPIGSHLSLDDHFPFSLDSFGEGKCVFDFVTKETEVLKEAAENGAVTVSGTRMLLHQAIAQFRLFTGLEEVPTEAMEKALLDALP